MHHTQTGKPGIHDPEFCVRPGDFMAFNIPGNVRQTGEVAGIVDGEFFHLRQLCLPPVEKYESGFWPPELID
jgi:hypothetical protein